MAITNVSTNKLISVSTSVNDLIMRYNKSVEKIYEIGAELDTMWDGDANSKFLVILGNDREKFNALTKLVGQYSGALGEAARIYAKAEQDVIEVLKTNTYR